MIGILGAVLLAVLGTYVLQSRKIDRVLLEANRENAAAHRATNYALQAQVHFKKQVQEWKNILLRGGNDGDLKKYTRQFRAEANRVRRVTRHLLAALPSDSSASRSAQAFAKAHGRLQSQYQQAYEDYLDNRSDPFRIDAMVRGIDREPTDLLDTVVEKVAAFRDSRFENGVRELATARRSVFVVGAIVFLAAILFTLAALRRWVYRPIATLTEAAQRLADGELGFSIDIGARGDLGVLGASFNQMSHRLDALVQQVRANTAIEKELEVAETVQATLIPTPTVHRLPGLEITGRYVPASRCGGDWWSFFRLSEHETLVLVGDVTGHGVPTTLITASVNASCKAICRTTDEIKKLSGADGMQHYIEARTKLSYVLDRLNQCILEVGQARFLMTFSAAVIDTRSARLTCATAGHEPPLLVRSGVAAVEPVFAEPSLRLGESRRPEFSEVSRSIGPADTVVWYTDGLVDVVGASHKAYGNGRLLRQLRKHQAASVDQVAQRVLDDVDAFKCDSASPDDMTLVVAKLVPPEQAECSLSPPHNGSTLESAWLPDHGPFVGSPKTRDR